MKQVTLKLEGVFAELAGVTEFKVFASSAREALQMLTQFPKLNPKKNSHRYVAKVDEVPTVDAMDSPLVTDVLTLRPQESEAFQGAGGDSGVLRIVVGIILIVVGVLLTIYSSGFGVTVGEGLIAAGIGMILGGLYMLLFPPEEPEASKNSLTLNNQNTTASGTPIPIILGETKFAGHIISYSVESDKLGTSEALNPETPRGWTRLEDTNG